MNRILKSVMLVASLSALAGNAVAATKPAGSKAVVATECATGRELHIGGADLQLVFDIADFALGAAPICRWTERSAQAVAHYFARFPVPAVRIVFQAVDSDDVRTGTTYGKSDEGGPLIVIQLGRRAGQAALDRDWVLTHEMVHLAVPSVPERSHWLEEGIATYVEPIARAQLGQLDGRKVWGDMFDGLPKGLPKAGDRGLDRTPTWGRTYWGGALFCLLADVQIRERTGNKKSLRDALRGIGTAGGDMRADWSVDRIFAAGDAATGVPVLAELYRAMALQPGPAQLDALWQQLGVNGEGGELHFVSDAPLAAIRDAITARDPAS